MRAELASIEAQGLGKCYRIYGPSWRRTLELLSGGRVRGHQELWALRGVDLELARGEALGVIGANGAGKSTLLSLLAGTRAPSEGRFRVRGRVTSLLELGTGFHPDFSGRANVRMQGVMQGVPRSELDALVDSVQEFAELGDFFDEPVRLYSSGMGMRLGFSAALALQPSVLILDEVFAVGDQRFQKKCVDRLYELKRAGVSILFCSHGLYEVRQLCERALWIEHGRVAAVGAALEVTERYYASGQGEVQAEVGASGAADPELPQILRSSLRRPGSEQEVVELDHGESLELWIWWRNPDPERTPIQLGAGLQRQDLTVCVGLGTHLDGVRLEGEQGCTVLELPDLALLGGSYLLPIWLFDDSGLHRYHESALPHRVVVRAPETAVGVYRPEHSWREESAPVPD